MSDDSGSCTFVGFLLVYIRGFSFYGPKQDRPRKYVNAFGRRDVVACFGSGSRRAETVQGAQSQGKEGGLPRLNSAVRKVGSPALLEFVMGNCPYCRTSGGKLTFLTAPFTLESLISGLKVGSPYITASCG